MTPQRYREAEQSGVLTTQERHEGWHFCRSLDGALEKPLSFCDCDPDNPVHMAIKCQERSLPFQTFTY